MSNKFVRIANSGENIKKMLDKGGIVDRLAKGGGGGGGSTTLINPDLSQNDETAIDYVKNRTHYVEETISIVDSVELTKDGFLIIRLNDNFSLNEKYYINIDNKISNLTITKDEYGNSHITGYPDWRFVDGHILTSLVNIPEVIDIYKEKVVTLDEKYIPDSVVRNFGKNNKAISENDTIFGTSNTAGTKAFYISSIDMENKQIYLSTTKTEGLPSLTDHQIDGNMLNSNLTNIVVGDVFSIINNVHYLLCGAVLDIDYDNGIITYGETTIALGDQYRKVKFPANLPFTEFFADTGIDGHTIYFHGKPEVGSVALKGSSFSVGQYNISAGKWSFNQGWNNIINGDNGIAFGDRNIVGYSAAAFGALGIANGERSFTEGQRTQAWGVNSHAAGQYTIAKGKNQFVIGQFNIPDENSLFIIGNGTNENSNISNAMTVDKNGNAWFAGDISLGKNSDKLLKSSDLYGVNKNIKLGEKNTLPTEENDTTKEANIAIGSSNTITTKWATTIGRNNTTSSEVSVLIGYQNKSNVTAGYNILIGTRNEATQGSTFAFGKDLITNRYEQTVLGRRNATDDQAIFIIGNGLNTNSRENVFVIKHNNEIYAAGNIYSDNKKLATEEYVNNTKAKVLIINGAPTDTTEGAVGVLAMDIDSETKDIYKCTAINEDGTYTWEILSSGNGDSIQVQSDMNQNDPKKADYIKNRTHYTEEVDGEEIVHPLDKKYLPEDIVDKVDGLQGGYVLTEPVPINETFDFDGTNQISTDIAKYFRNEPLTTITISVYKDGKLIYTKQETKNVNSAGTVIRSKFITGPSGAFEWILWWDPTSITLDMDILGFDAEAEGINISDCDKIEVSIVAEGAEIYTKKLDGEYVERKTITFDHLEPTVPSKIYNDLVEKQPFATYKGSVKVDYLNHKIHSTFRYGEVVEGTQIHYDLVINGENVKGVSKPATLSADNEHFVEVIIGNKYLTDYALKGSTLVGNGTLYFDFLNPEADYSVEVNAIEIVVPMPSQLLGLSKGIRAGYDTTITDESKNTHNFGTNNYIDGNYNSAFGTGNTIRSQASMAIGQDGTIEGDLSFLGGDRGNVSGRASIGYGQDLKVDGDTQAVFGKYNDSDADAALIIGNGDSDSSRKNVFAVKKNGNILINKTLFAEEDFKKIKTFTYVGTGENKTYLKAANVAQIGHGNINGVTYDGKTYEAAAANVAQIGKGNQNLSAKSESSVQLGRENKITSDCTGGYIFQLGYANESSQSQSYLVGRNLLGNYREQVVVGKYNEVVEGIFVVGNGTDTKRSNAMVIDKYNAVSFAGDVYSKGNKVLTGSDLNALGGTIASLVSEIEELKNEKTALNDSISFLQSDINTLTARIEALENK